MGGWEGLILGWSGTRSSPLGTDGSPSMPFRLTGTPAPTPAVPFTFFFPQKSRGGGGLVGVSPVKGVPGRGGDRLSGILYSCSNNTNSGGNGREKTRPLKLLVV